MSLGRIKKNKKFKIYTPPPPMPTTHLSPPPTIPPSHPSTTTQTDLIWSGFDLVWIWFDFSFFEHLFPTQTFHSSF